MWGWTRQLWNWLSSTGRVERIDIEAFTEGWQGLSQQMVERLAESEQRFRATVEAAPTAMVMIDREGRIVLVNAETERLFGYSREALTGQAIELLVPERFRRQHPGHRAGFFANPEARRMGAGRDLFGLRKDGSEFLVEIGLNPVETAEGLFVLSAIADITQRKLAEAAGARLAAIVESSHDAIIGKTLDGIVTSWNRGAEELYGYTADEMVGRPITQISPPDRPDEVPAILERLRRGETVDPFETVRISKDGTRVDVSLSISPIKNAEGLPVGASAIARDISERKRAEQQIQQYAADLERSNRELDQFAYSASHDLKAPLRAIENLVGFVLDDAGHLLPEDARNDLQTAQQRVRRMEKLLEDLLEYSRVGKMRGQIETIDTGALVRDVVELLAPPEQFTIEIGELPALTTDRAPLEQTFRNLIGNAIKHHDRPNGRVSVSGKDCGGAVEFSVADDGPGICSEFHETVFEMFETLRPRDEVEGSGMGLALVKKIVEVRGGAVRLESNGRGTLFRVRWPKRQV